MLCKPETILTVKKEVFLNNSKSKESFISLLSGYLENAGCQCEHAEADADSLIVNTAIGVCSEHETVVIAEDTDILVLLCHHAVSDQSKGIYMKQEAKASTAKVAKEGKFWDIHALQALLGVDLCKHLPFLHALLGCDTTSRLFGVGKVVSLKKYTDLVPFAEIFHPRMCLKNTSLAQEKRL